MKECCDRINKHPHRWDHNILSCTMLQTLSAIIWLWPAKTHIACDMGLAGHTTYTRIRCAIISCVACQATYRMRHVDWPARIACDKWHGRPQVVLSYKNTACVHWVYAETVQLWSAWQAIRRLLFPPFLHICFAGLFLLIFKDAICAVLSCRSVCVKHLLSWFTSGPREDLLEDSHFLLTPKPLLSTMQDTLSEQSSSGENGGLSLCKDPWRDLTCSGGDGLSDGYTVKALTTASGKQLLTRDPIKAGRALGLVFPEQKRSYDKSFWFLGGYLLDVRAVDFLLLGISHAEFSSTFIPLIKMNQMPPYLREEGPDPHTPPQRISFLDVASSSPAVPSQQDALPITSCPPHASSATGTPPLHQTFRTVIYPSNSAYILPPYYPPRQPSPC